MSDKPVDESRALWHTAYNIRDLKKLLQKVPSEGTWSVMHCIDHDQIMCYDPFGKLHTVIRNRS